MKQNQSQKQTISLIPMQVEYIKSLSLTFEELKEKILKEEKRNPVFKVKREKRDSSFKTNSFSSQASIKHEELINSIEYKENSKTLKEELLFQLDTFDLDQREHKIGEYLIENLNDNGFHIKDPLTLFKNVSEKEINKMISLIQKFYPEGSCTKDFKESLLVQIKIKEEFYDEHKYSFIKKIIENDFELLKKDSSNIIKKYNLSQDSFQEELYKLKDLNLFSYIGLNSNEAETVFPEVEVFIENNKIKINTVFDQLPDIDIDKDSVQDRGKTEDAMKLLFAIQNFKTSFNKMVYFIVNWQKDFFYMGEKEIKPLTLKEVSDGIGIDKSNISRMMKNRYMQTPFGIRPFKFLFSSKLNTIDKGNKIYSKRAVMCIIKEINLANKNKISDQKISNLLKKKGIKIERRTVSKYQNEIKKKGF